MNCRTCGAPHRAADAPYWPRRDQCRRCYGREWKAAHPEHVKRKRWGTCATCGQTRLARWPAAAECPACYKRRRYVPRPPRAPRPKAAPRPPEHRPVGSTTNLKRGGPVVTTCEQCGIEFGVFPSKLRAGRGRFCSKACDSEWKRRTYVGRTTTREYARGPAHPNWRGGPRRGVCVICEATYETHSPVQQTCSESCGRKLFGLRVRGANNPWARANPVLTHTCRACGRVFTQRRGAVNGHVYCSLACAQRMSRHSYVQQVLADALAAAGLIVEQEKTWPWLWNEAGNRHLRVDIYLPSLAVAIEYDGRHHRDPAAFGGGSERLRQVIARDARKARLLTEHGIRLIRVDRWPVDIAELLA